jgi:hypothetical protein
MKLETQLKGTLAIATLAAIAGVLNFLALSDIYHKEEDLSLEWTIVRYSNAVFLLFLCASVWTLWRGLRSRPS